MNKLGRSLIAGALIKPLGRRRFLVNPFVRLSAEVCFPIDMLNLGSERNHNRPR